MASGPRPSHEHDSLELARLLLDSVGRLQDAGETKRAREAYEKAHMIYRASRRRLRDMDRRLAEAAALLGIQAKPLGRETEGRKQSRKAGA